MRRDDTRVNILVFLAAAALVFFALVAFARYPGLFVRGREYQAVFRSAAGLNRGDEVRFGGLLVGTVTDIELDPQVPTRIVVRFTVRKSTPVRADTRAAVGQVGLLGEPYLALAPGRPNAPTAPEGMTLASDETLSFQEAMTKLARFMERTDTLFAMVEGVQGTNPLERFDRTLSRLETLIGTTSANADRVMGQFETAGRQLSVVLERSDRVLATVDTTIRGTGPGLADTQKEALATLRETRQLVSDIRLGFQREGGVDQLIRNLTVATDNLARLSARIERDPSSVLKRRVPPTKTAGPAAR